jgi:hypothetical protein
MHNSTLNKFFLFLLLVIVVSVTDAYGQRWKLLRYQVGLGIGTAQIFGDIGGSADENNWFGLKDIRFQETGFLFGANARYKVDTRVSVKANFNMGLTSASDAGTKNDRGRSYKATLIEFSGQYEYYFITEEPKQKSAAMFNRRGMINNYSSFSAYAFVGLGATFSKLKHDVGTSLAIYDNYKATNLAPVIPFGVGAKFVIDEKWFIGSEFGYRWSANDYVEGYSQIEGSKYNDLYYFLLFSVNRRLKTSRRGFPAFIDHKMH